MKLKMCELILCQDFIILIYETSSFINKFELIISFFKKNSWYFYKILVSKISKFDDSKSRVVTKLIATCEKHGKSSKLLMKTAKDGYRSSKREDG